MRRTAITVIPFALFAAAALAGEVVHVSPGDSLAEVSRRLASDTEVTEVVLAGGIYTRSLRIPPFTGPDGSGATGVAARAAAPLIVRPAEGARVIFDGAIGIPNPRPVRGRPGVFSFAHAEEGREPPKIWEPGGRVRYTLAADLDAVERFAGTYILHEGRIYFHTSDGLPPGDRAILMSALDYGVSIHRPDVTVRDLEFRNFVARGKWSAAVQTYGDRGTVERCAVSNASFGFFAAGSRDALVDCTARDVGGGVYVGGEDNRVEGCRFFKERDAFMVPTYAQDDSGIQFYHPARGGVIRGNLSVGFGIGILIKASPAPWVVERNTLVGRGLKHGFIATVWHPGEIFRHNIVADYATPIQTPPGSEPREIGRNCYRPAGGRGRGPVEPGSIVCDPGFVDPAAADYRLDPESPCLKAADGDGRIGALPVAIPEASPPQPPRERHVSPSGSDGAEGTGEAPLRSIQAAVDRSVPGDTILLHPGIYPDPVRIGRGGGEGRPITIRALKKWTAILDGDRRADTMIAIEAAPFVAIRDLEIRWYRSIGVLVRDADDVTVSGCRIWNAHWGGTWPNGTAVHVENSRRFLGDRNVLFSQERGFYMLRSPHATITRNTAVANLYGGAAFIYSIEGSVCRNNSFAFQGNDAIVVVETAAGKDLLATFDCDYNNYGMTLRDQPPGVAVDRITPRHADRHLLTPSKAIVSYTEEPGELHRFLTLREWRDFSGRDLHSIVADPLYVSTAGRDFRLGPGSPNIGAGADGATIGAAD